MNNFVFLSDYQALSPGADLWILPTLEESFWTQKIDYYLNFQISKQTSQETSVLILANDRLPSKKNIIFKFDRDWNKKAYNFWKNLQKPTLRIFLSHYLDSKDCLKDLSSEFKKIQIVSPKNKRSFL